MDRTHLAVVAGEVEVVQSVVGGRVDVPLEKVSADHVAIVNEDGPQLNKDEKTEIEVFVKWEDVDEDVVGKGLSVSIHRVESESSPGRWH
jgi:hypothetical protein